MAYRDPARQKAAQHNHYLKNKKKYRAACTKSRPKFRYSRGQWLNELKSGLHCKICKEDRIPCLEFHHRNPKEKEFAISNGVWQFSRKKILAEIRKCEILCSNCHAVLHWEETMHKYRSLGDYKKSLKNK